MIEIQPPPVENVSYQEASETPIEKFLQLLALPHVDKKESPSHFSFLNELRYFKVSTLNELQIQFSIHDLDVQIQERLAESGKYYHVEKINEILSDLCGLCVDSPYDLKDFLFGDRILSTGDYLLDDVLEGGFQCGSLTEICGESSCGKTQICLQLLLQCVCPHIIGGLDSRSCYITTENYPRSRLVEMIKHRIDTLHNYIAKVEKTSFPNLQTVEQFLDRILVRERVIYTVEEFNQVIYGILQETIQDNPVKLIVIDSIAALYRTPRDQEGINYQNRAKELWKLSSYLKRLAFEKNICIVLVNHVSDRFETLGFSSSQKCQLTGGHFVHIDDASYMGTNKKKKPAMGLFWSNMVNTRIMLSRKKDCKVQVRNEKRATKKKMLNDRTVVYVHKESEVQKSNSRDNEEEEEGEEEYSNNKDFSSITSNGGREEENHDGYYPHRELRIVFSPTLKEEKGCYFVIDKVGVRGIEIQEASFDPVFDM